MKLVSVFDKVWPCYLLDKNFDLVDWNTAFSFILKQMSIQVDVSENISKVLERLENEDQVQERALKVFGQGEAPLVDTELLVFKGQNYGRVEVQKLAVQVFGPQEKFQCWCVNWNILSFEKGDLFQDLADFLSERVAH